jgi:hypothetical protein
MPTPAGAHFAHSEGCTHLVDTGKCQMTQVMRRYAQRSQELLARGLLQRDAHFVDSEVVVLHRGDTS